jgi:hypothetical protein
LFAGCQKKEETPPPAPVAAPAPAKPAIVSAVKNSFDQVTAKLDKGGSFYLYLSTEQILSGLSEHLAAASNIVSGLPNIPGTGRQTLDKVFAVLDVVVKQSGISEISGLGMSSIARETEFILQQGCSPSLPWPERGHGLDAFWKVGPSSQGTRPPAGNHGAGVGLRF